MNSHSARRERKCRILPLLPRGAPPWDGRPIRCALCKRPGVAGERSVGEWRCLNADGVLHYLCPGHFPADGAGAEAFGAAYDLIFAALGLRIGPDTDLAFQGAEP